MVCEGVYYDMVQFAFLGRTRRTFATLVTIVSRTDKQARIA